MVDKIIDNKSEKYFIELKITAYEWGIYPLILDDMEILDVAYWCLAQKEKRKADIESEKMKIYSQANAIAHFIAPLFSKNRRPPTYDELFPKVKNNENGINSKEDIANHLIERRKAKYG